MAALLADTEIARATTYRQADASRSLTGPAGRAAVRPGKESGCQGREGSRLSAASHSERIPRPVRSPCPHPSQLLFWVDGSMPPEEAERTARHAAECRSCGERVAMLRSTVLGQPAGPATEPAPPAASGSGSGGGAGAGPSGFAATLKRSRNTPASLTPGLPVSKVLGADTAPTTPFIPAER